MKKAFSIFLLSIFLFEMVGHYPLFKYAQYKIQKEIKGRLKKSVPDSELFVIAIPADKVNELDWKREGKEFRYKGTMYDIVKSENKGDEMIYHCVNDKQETQLFAQLEELVNQHIDSGKSPFGKTTKRILKKISSLKYVPATNFSFAVNSTNYNSDFNYSFSYPSVLLKVSTPPPNPIA